MKLEKFTQKKLKAMVANGTAMDITHGENVPTGLTLMGVSTGVYGANGALFSDKSGTKYAVTARCTNLFKLL